MIIAVTVVTGVTAAGVAWVVSGRVHADPAAPRLRARRVQKLLRRHRAFARFVRQGSDPEAETRGLLALAAVAVIIPGALVGALLAMVRSNSGLARGDDPLATWAAEHTTDASAQFLELVSLLGGFEAVIVAAVAVAVVEVHRQRSWPIVAFLAVTIGGQFAIVHAVKAIVDRVRPDVLRLTGFAGASFPSGHAAAATATFACFAFVIGRGRSRRVKRVLTAGAAAVAAAVGATRIFLGVHWLTDVVAGTAIGWSWFAICSVAFGGRRLRFGAPIALAERLAQHPEDSAGARTRRAPVAARSLGRQPHDGRDGAR